MGLKATIQKATGSAFSALGDLVESVTYKAQLRRDYEPQAGHMVATDDEPAVDAVFITRKTKDPETGARVQETVAIVQAQELVNAGITPRKDDKLVRGNGRVYNVIDFEEDPADAAVIFVLEGF